MLRLAEVFHRQIVSLPLDADRRWRQRHGVMQDADGKMSGRMPGFKGALNADEVGGFNA